MNNQPDNPPAFPVRPNEAEALSCHQGISTRDYFAAKILQGMAAGSMWSDNFETSEPHRMRLAIQVAFAAADMAMEERSKPNP